MVRPKKTMGVGALISVLANRVHPSKHIREKHRNMRNGMRIIDCRVIRLEVKKISRKDQEAIVFTHSDYKEENGLLVELYACKRYCKILQEGPPDQFFIADSNDDVENVNRDAEGEVELPDIVRNSANSGGTALNEIISQMRSEGFFVDDDNLPVEENVPDVITEASSDGERRSIDRNDVMQEWKHDGLCLRKITEARDYKASLKKYCTDEMKFTKLQFFELMIPKHYFITVILPTMNKNLPAGEKNITYGEFLKFLGLRFLMATVQGPQYRDYWSEQPISMFRGAPFRFFDFMSRNRFDIILQSLAYTNENPPTIQDRFWEIRKLISAWNKNMSDTFSASWISCLDESMSKWMQRYTCPGFVFCPRKPWPFGNEYHTIACGESGILFFMEMVEGKDKPSHLPQEHSQLGSTIGLMLRCTKPLHGTGKVVVLDSGFCVLKGVIELKKRGVFAAALIKKRRYWPKYVPGEEIKAHFMNRGVGDVDCWHGKLDEVQFHLHCMREPDYIMSLMSTYGTMDRIGEEKSRSWKENGVTKTTKFQYPEVVHNHYKYRHMVDDHNARRQSPISLEESWATRRWPNRVFAFILGVSEVNAMLAEAYFSDTPQPSMLDFRKQLAKELIHNSYDVKDDGKSIRKSRRKIEAHSHELLSLPKKTKFDGVKVVESVSDYPQFKCKTCNKRVRTYCRCSPGSIRCTTCHLRHVVECETVH